MRCSCGSSGKPNVLGAAVQLCTLPWLGFVPDEVRSAPVEAVTRLAERLDIRARLLAEYGVREQTRTDHLREIAGYLGWRSADETEWKQLQEFLFSRAMEHDPPRLLFRLVCEYLMSSRVIRPGVVTMLKRVATAREIARRDLAAGGAPGRGRPAAGGAGSLLVVDPLVGFTRCAWLGRGATQPVACRGHGRVGEAGILAATGRAQAGLSMLPAERRRFLAALGRRSTAQSCSAGTRSAVTRSC